MNKYNQKNRTKPLLLLRYVYCGQFKQIPLQVHNLVYDATKYLNYYSY